MTHPPPIFLLGPTASGKTALALPLAEALDAEIVSIDSALVYRGMDIGSAKPDAEELARVPHHLIDIVAPDEPYSAARFADDALAAIRSIRSRGRRVLLVGGTFLYYKVLVEGMAPMPPANVEVRRQLSESLAEQGSEALHAELRSIDPVAAERIHPNDPQRLLRALEVFRVSGQTLTALQANTRPLLTEEVRAIALVPDSRAWLHGRIARRLDAMEDAGFLDEVRRLAALELPRDLPALKSVGYRQALDALHAGDISAWKAAALVATRQLAKRQLTWLRSLEGIEHIACDQLSIDQQLDAALKAIAQP